MTVDGLSNLAQALEDLAAHIQAASDQLDEQAGHLGSVKTEVSDAEGLHAAVYDGQSETGDGTRGALSGTSSQVEEALTEVTAAVDALNGQAAAIHQAAEDVRAYIGRVVAAGGS